MPYAELELNVERVPGGAHTLDLRFRADPADLDRDLVVNAPLAIDAARQLALSGDDEAYGAALSATLFADARVREAFIAARAAAEAQGLPLRIRLRLDPADPGLHGIRWEALHDDQGVAIARSERLLLSRYLDSADMTRFVTPARPDVRGLVVVASPADLAAFGLAPFDAGAEAERVRQSLGAIPTATLVSGAAPVTLAALTDALRLGYSLLTIVCHGKIVDGAPYLALEGETGQVEWVPGETLAERIRDLDAERRPALIVLASCQSVGAAHDGALPSALAPQLARAGVAAVVGMQGDVPQAMVARLLPRFFEQLAEDGQVDRALAVARAGLADDDPWWMPALFLRARDGRIWHEAATPAPAPTSRPAAPAPRRRPWVVAGLGLAAAAILALLTLLPRGATQAQAPAAAPAAPPAPTAAPVAPAPLADGRLLVLVSRIDAPAAGGRDLTAEIEAELRRTVADVPFSDLTIARYDGPVRSEAEAASLAAQSRAAVVLWGGGGGPAPTLNVQIGDPGVFAAIPPALDEALLRRTADVELRLDLAAPTLPSPALAVLTVLNVLRAADGDGFEVLRTAGLIDRLQHDVTAADTLGGGTAPKLHRFLRRYFSAPEQARPVIDAALDDDPANPLLALYSAMLHQRLSEYEDGYEDAQAAYDAAPGWSSPAYLLAVDRLVKGFPMQALASLDEVVAARPDDSYARAYRGAMRYLVGLDREARDDLREAIAQGPETSLPYGFAAAIALREGRVAEATELARQARERFGAQRSFDNNLYRNLFGQENLFGLTIAAFDQLLYGQNRDAIASAERALGFVAGGDLNRRLHSDLNLIAGLAECRRREPAAAAAGYTRAIAADGGYPMLHLLRAQALAALDDDAYRADIAAVERSVQAQILEPALSAALRGDLDCVTLFE